MNFVEPIKLASSFSLLLATGIAACAPAAALAPPAYKRRPELAAIRLYVPPTASLTWSDDRCAALNSRLRVEYAQQVASELSRAGFTVSNSPSGADAQVHVQATLSFCSYT